uniref:AIG1-type G domain-containing protein n=1 Tax=Neovison vison TaxID=452646 RepID=A0A8C7EJD8_NEOVI
MYSGGLAQVGVRSLSPRELLTLGSRFWTWCGCPGPPLKCYEGGLAFCGFFPDSLKVLLVGRRGAGKSASGNNLLGNRVFKTKFSEGSVTQRTWGRLRVVVVDTPSLYLTTSAEGGLSQLEEEVRGCLSCCEEGNKVLVLVFQLGWFTQEDKREVHNVLFTWKEDLESGDFEECVQNTDNKTLKNIIKRCVGGRVCASNNREMDTGGPAVLSPWLGAAWEGHGFGPEAEVGPERAAAGGCRLTVLLGAE